jgi:hypothetical protein
VASHRQELFTRLRMAGVSIGTAELYGLEIGE